MITKTTIVGGLLMLIYLKANAAFWSLSVNTNNIISQKIINVINIMPPFCTSLCYYSIMLLCIISLFKNNIKIRLIMYSITIIILTIGAKIMLSLFCFADMTDLWLVIINHPVPQEIKQYYLLSELESIIRYSSPNIYMKPEILEWYKQQISLSSNKCIDLNMMTPKEITQYAKNILNTDDHSKVITIITNTLSIAAISAIIITFMLLNP